jgi:hypothetical protein
LPRSNIEIAGIVGGSPRSLTIGFSGGERQLVAVKNGVFAVRVRRAGGVPTRISWIARPSLHAVGTVRSAGTGTPSDIAREPCAVVSSRARPRAQSG